MVEGNNETLSLTTLNLNNEVTTLTSLVRTINLKKHIER